MALLFAYSKNLLYLCALFVCNRISELHYYSFIKDPERPSDGTEGAASAEKGNEYKQTTTNITRNPNYAVMSIGSNSVPLDAA